MSHWFCNFSTCELLERASGQKLSDLSARHLKSKQHQNTNRKTITDQLAIKRLQVNMANIQPLQHPPFNFGAAAEAHLALANQNQAFAENQAALTPDVAFVLQEICNLRAEMNARFDRMEQRADTECILYPLYLRHFS